MLKYYEQKLQRKSNLLEKANTKITTLKAN